jgi:hypothetical protein
MHETRVSEARFLSRLPILALLLLIAVALVLKLRLDHAIDVH